jgi:hypothetical protein
MLASSFEFDAQGCFSWQQPVQVIQLIVCSVDLVSVAGQTAAYSQGVYLCDSRDLPKQIKSVATVAATAGSVAQFNYTLNYFLS